MRPWRSGGRPSSAPLPRPPRPPQSRPPPRAPSQPPPHASPRAPRPAPRASSQPPKPRATSHRSWQETQKHHQVESKAKRQRLEREPRHKVWDDDEDDWEAGKKEEEWEEEEWDQEEWDQKDDWKAQTRAEPRSQDWTPRSAPAKLMVAKAKVPAPKPAPKAKVKARLPEELGFSVGSGVRRKEFIVQFYFTYRRVLLLRSPKTKIVLGPSMKGRCCLEMCFLQKLHHASSDVLLSGADTNWMPLCTEPSSSEEEEDLQTVTRSAKEIEERRRHSQQPWQQENQNQRHGAAPGTPPQVPQTASRQQALIVIDNSAELGE
ncbi:unnamed protein product, partial [Effrenium voratum]